MNPKYCPHGLLATCEECNAKRFEEARRRAGFPETPPRIQRVLSLLYSMEEAARLVEEAATDEDRWLDIEDFLDSASQLADSLREQYGEEFIQDVLQNGRLPEQFRNEP